MTTKTFDCVEMKRRGAKLLQERLAGLTREQQLAFWREQFQRLKALQESVRARTAAGGVDRP